MALEYRDKIDFEKGILHDGCRDRLLGAMERALKGEKLTLAFLGGSITQGSLSSTPETCYAYRTYAWWKEAFPEAEFTYVNAGIGGTTSHLGAGRVEEEVLSHNPDVVVVEFSVNDDGSKPQFLETYEGLVRRILNAPCAPALLLVHNIRYDNGDTAEEIHSRVGRHYDLTCLSMQSTVYPLVKEGKIENREITPDDLHPNDEGHALLSELITTYLAKVKENAKQNLAENKSTVCNKAELPAPLTKNAYEGAHRYRNDELIPVLCEGFEKDETPQACVSDCFKKGWQSARNHDKIVFDVEASCIAIQYRKTVRRPAPIAKAVIDGNEENAVILDANFEEDWGDCLYLKTVMEHGEKKLHRVEIQITKTHEDDREGFYLVSLITA